MSKDKKTPVTAKADAKAAPKKKLTQAEWDKKFGGEDTAVAAPAKGKVKSEKPAAKAVAKPVAKSKPAAKEEDKVHGRIASTNSRKLRADISKIVSKSKIVVAVAEAFGKGKTIEDAVTDLEIGYEPPRSAEYKKNPRKYLLGYISHMINKGILSDV